VIIAVCFADGLSSGYFCYISGLKLKNTQYIMLSMAWTLALWKLVKWICHLCFLAFCLLASNMLLLMGQLDINGMFNIC